MATSIHPTAIVDPKASIGAGSSIGPYAVVERGAEIGDNCVVGPHAMIGEGTRIGSHCRIFHGASVGLIPQDLKFKGEKTLLRIGDRTTIREFCTLNRGTDASGETVVGSDCLIMACAHVAHDCVVGDHTILANSVAMGGHVEIGSHVNVGGLVPIHQFTRIGDHSFIASAARPFMDVVPFALVGVDGDTYIAGINKVGLERRGFSSERRLHIRRAFSILFRQDLALADAVARLTETFQGNEDVKRIVTFIKGSRRGIMRMKHGAGDDDLTV
jgi:UDP-N-acetylglucosamine acyltransferase